MGVARFARSTIACASTPSGNSQMSRPRREAAGRGVVDGGPQVGPCSILVPGPSADWV